MTKQSNHESETNKSMNVHDKERTPPSIPSRFDVVIHPQLNQPESNAFGTRTCRFHDLLEDIPGPGAYYKATSYVKDPVTCGSTSIRGYTTMISKTPRFNKNCNSDIPGPGAYDLSTSVDVYINTVTNSHFFAKPIHSSKSSETRDTPGPGHYNIEGINRLRAPFGSSAFKSTERKGEATINNSSGAAVGSYDVARSIDVLQYYGSDERRGKPFPSASFASGSKRIADVDSTTITPGPGYYSLDGIDSVEDIKRANTIVRVSLRRTINSSDNAKYINETPGPGWYYSEYENTKSNGVTSVFKSYLPRFSDDHFSRAPGPAYYRPKCLEKKSFLMNKDKKWI